MDIASFIILMVIPAVLILWVIDKLRGRKSIYQMQKELYDKEMKK